MGNQPSGGLWKTNPYTGEKEFVGAGGIPTWELKDPNINPYAAGSTTSPPPYTVPGGGTIAGGTVPSGGSGLPSGGVSGGVSGSLGAPLGGMFDDYIGKMKGVFDKTKALEYDPNILANLTAGEFRGAGASERGQEAKRGLIGTGVNPNSLTFGREMDKVGREREANIYDSIAKGKMGESAFGLDKSGALGDLLKSDVNFSNVMSDYLTKSTGLGLEAEAMSLDNIWNSINRGDYLTLLSSMFGMPPTTIPTTT